jgi:hypothetical protein
MLICIIGIDISSALLKKTPNEHLQVLTARNMTEYTVNRGLRPPIPPNCPTDMKFLIERCWYYILLLPITLMISSY